MESLVKLILSQIPLYISNVAGLIASPKKFVRERNASGDEELTKALTFLAISFVLSVVLQIPLMPDKFDVWKFVVVSGTTSLVLIMLNVAALRAAWRMVGGRAQFRSFLITFSYHSAIALIFVVLTFLCIAGTFKLFVPKAWAAAQAGNPIDPSTLNQGAAIAASIGFLGFIFLGIVGLFAWSTLCWGAYRELNRLSKAQSVAAYFIFNFFSIPLLVISVLLTKAIY